MATTEERAEIEQRVEEHGRELRQAIGELREAALAWTDPRDPIRARPAGWIAGGFAMGLWLGWKG